MRRFALLIAALPLLLAAAPDQHIDNHSERKADLTRIAAYLNSQHMLEGDFVQVDPNGALEQGKFWLKKPGRIRFEYAPPNPLLIVADGHSVTVQNRKLNTTDHYPLFGSPLNLIINDATDLPTTPRVVAVRHNGDTIVVDAKTNAQALRANVSIVFTWPELDLRQWTVVDAQGLETTVALRNVRAAESIPDSLFNPPASGEKND